jgi:DNA-binding NarL/FixJ family response regulator
MLVLVTDLIFATKITSTASALGVAVKTVRSIEKLRERLNTLEHETVLIDLNSEGVDVLEAIRAAKAAAHRPRVIAYASHVQADLIAQARQAGADEVMARSAFVQKLPALLQQERKG